MKNIVIRLCAGALTAATIACNLSTPARPTPTVVTGGSGGATLKVSAPSPQSPANGVKLTEIVNSGITLSAAGSTPTFASSASLQYQFELMNASGSVIERSDPLNSPTWRQSSALEYDTRYQWRLRALQDDGVGPWSVIFSFTTSDLPPEFRCRPPFMSAAIDILNCHRDLVDSLDHDTAIVFLRRVTRDFNIARVPGGPFGMLRKATGNNCHGYSCDIICSGQGNSQVQYDILINDDIPIWGGSGNDIFDDIRVDFCEIQ